MPKLFVIPGHGAGDPGAGGFGFNEAERVRHLATRMKAIGGDMVELGDFNRNYYEDEGLNTLNVAPGTQIIELHMDSAGKDARGGHVIIKNGFAPDQYDKELALFISTMFPGRSQTIVNRANLANVNRAAARGLPYRLLECCFISNRDDLDKFNKQTDDLARGILKSFGIGAAVPKDTNAAEIQLYQSNSTDAQKFIFDYTGATKTIGGKVCKAVRLKNLSSGKYLDVPSAKAESGAKLRVYKGNGSNAQLWYEQVHQFDTDTYVNLYSTIDTNLVMEVKGAAKANGAAYQLYKPNGTDAQKFVKVYAGRAGTYFICNQTSGKMMDVLGGGK